MEEERRRNGTGRRTFHALPVHPLYQLFVVVWHYIKWIADYNTGNTLLKIAILMALWLILIVLATLISHGVSGMLNAILYSLEHHHHQ